MTHYLLAIHTGEAPQRDMSPGDMQDSFRAMNAIEDDLKSTGAWVFSGRLHEADTATVVRDTGARLLTTDGPFVESKEHLAGFYIIQAEDLDGALGWAGRVSAATRMPIEVRPFAFTGELKDALGQAQSA